MRRTGSLDFTATSTQMCSSLRRTRSISRYPQHEHLISTTRTCILDLRETINMDGWRTTAPFPVDLMQAHSNTSFDANGSPGNGPGHQWYGPIEAACRQLPAALVAWRNSNEEIDYRRWH